MIFFIKNYNGWLIISNDRKVHEKHTASENSSVRKTKQIKIMLLSNCAVCSKKKSNFIKNKELHIFHYIWNDEF